MTFKRAVRPVPVAALPEMTTRQLMGLRDRLLRLPQCEEAVNDYLPEEFDRALINFKNDPRWAELHRALKEQLAMREHLPKSTERAARRKAQTQPSNRGRKELPRGVRARARAPAR